MKARQRSLDLTKVWQEYVENMTRNWQESDENLMRVWPESDKYLKKSSKTINVQLWQNPSIRNLSKHCHCKSWTDLCASAETKITKKLQDWNKKGIRKVYLGSVRFLKIVALTNGIKIAGVILKCLFIDKDTYRMRAIKCRTIFAIFH